jgi:SAM-dependent methyltransferase
MRSRVARHGAPSAVGAPSSSPAGPEPLPRTLGAIPGPASGHVTEALFGRLTAEQIAAVRNGIREEHRAVWEQASPDERKSMTLALGLLYGVDGISERTGLVAAAPPRDVHSMVHGLAWETGGSYYLADMVLEALLGIGRPLAAGAEALDFSCSSGRVVRPLSAALPAIIWRGCDPNVEAIKWARAHVPGVDFFVSPIEPPLPLTDGQLSLAFAMSVWSHYSAAAALRWLNEMARVIRPRGHLLLTTHGLNSCAWFGQNPAASIDIEAKLGPAWIAQTVRRLELDGHCFWDVFGSTGDWGVVDSDWGLSFFTPEWLLANITPTWSVHVYRIGRAQGNQDVYLLERT